MKRGVAGRVVLGWVLASVVLGACKEGRPPRYVRLSGEAPAISDLPEGKAHLITFWGTWCPPCVEETPSLRALAKEAPSGLRVVVVSVGDDDAALRAFFGGAPPADWHLRRDEEAGLVDGFGVDELPASFLLVGGQKVARFDGPRDWNAPALRRLLARLMSESAPQPPAGERAP